MKKVFDKIWGWLTLKNAPTWLRVVLSVGALTAVIPSIGTLFRVFDPMRAAMFSICGIAMAMDILIPFNMDIEEEDDDAEDARDIQVAMSDPVRIPLSEAQISVMAQETEADLMRYPTPWKVAQAPRGGNFHIYDANDNLVPMEGTVWVLNRICVAVNFVSQPEWIQLMSDYNAPRIRKVLRWDGYGRPVVMHSNGVDEISPARSEWEPCDPPKPESSPKGS